MTRPARSALTALGTALGVAALVAILGMTQTAAAQVSQAFEAVNLRTITAESAPVGDAPLAAFTSEGIARVARIDGVVEVGALTRASRSRTPVRTGLLGDGAGEGADVVGATPDAIRAVGGRVSEGRAFDAGHLRRRDRVVVLGVAAARRMGLPPVRFRPVLFIGGVPFTVIGVLDATAGHPDLLSAATIPSSTLVDLWGTDVVAGDQLVVEARPGATQVVGPQVAAAVRPTAPEAVQVTTPPAPRGLRRAIDGDLTSLLVVLAAVALVIGLVGIGNTTLVSVMERVPEFGLRRSLGATPVQNALQVLAESSLLGILGGMVGASAGVIAVTSLSVSRGWTPTLDVALVPMSVAVGGLVGAVAGLYPAIRASSIEPDDALRR